MFSNSNGDGHDEISNVGLLDLHALPSRSSVCGGLTESNTTLSGCLEEQSNFIKSLKGC